MEDWQERVVAEQRELQEKITKLEVFLPAENLSDEDNGLLFQQLQAMKRYSKILLQRINNFAD